MDGRYIGGCRLCLQIAPLEFILSKRANKQTIVIINTFPVQGCKRDLTSGKATVSDIGYGKN